MFIVVLALGTTDLLFALDSIPAIYGLTKEPYLVLTANIFALMGLRQLYFLIGGLLQRLVYLSYGLALLLGFIGVKLILHAMHENELPFINGGEPIEWAPDIPILVSLGVILGILAVTTVASLIASKNGRARTRASSPRRSTTTASRPRTSSRRATREASLTPASGQGTRPAETSVSRRCGASGASSISSPPSGACSIQRVPSSATGRVTNPTW